MAEKKHVLDISMYSFSEILGLFDMTYDITVEDLKRAKKKVLMLHPDKSKLSSDYFLFYKKALDHIYNYYQQTKKTEHDLHNTNTAYVGSDLNRFDKHTTHKIAETVSKMNTESFNRTFNKVFDEQIASKKKQSDKNSWFKEDTPVFQTNTTNKNVNVAIQQIKTENKGLMLAKYTGVRELASGKGTDLYEDLGNEDDEEDSDIYVSSDPFSKLKFDDLRKVHKDQTIFAVSENDYTMSPMGGNVENYKRERGQQNLTPMEKKAAEHMLREKEMEFSKKIAQKQYKSSLETQKYEQMNQNILSRFLRIQN